MVLKKSNTLLNTGGTQREVKRGKYWLRTGEILERNLITFRLSSSFMSADDASRSSDFGTTLAGLRFLADHCGWEELAKVDFCSIRHKDRYSTLRKEPILRFNLNKKKRWLLPQKLVTLICTYQWILEEALNNKPSKNYRNPKGVSPDVWDEIALAGITNKAKLGAILTRTLKSGVHVSGDFVDNLPDFCRACLRFGLMDVLADFQLNVTSSKVRIDGGLGDHAVRDKVDYTTSVSDRDHTQVKGQGKTKDSMKLKRESMKRKPHARGIQRPHAWNKNSTSKKHKSSKKNDDSDLESESCNPYTGLSPSCKDQVNVTILRDVQTDKRLLEWNPVIKKYGHLPYNAPRKAICKTKRRFEKKIDSHRSYRYRRLKEDTIQAQLELSTNKQGPHPMTLTLKNGENHDSDINESTPAVFEACARDAVTNERHGVTLKDFLVNASKPRASKKKAKRAMKSLPASPANCIDVGDTYDDCSDTLFTGTVLGTPTDSLAFGASFAQIDLACDDSIVVDKDVQEDWVLVDGVDSE